MENDTQQQQQPWALIAIAGLSLVIAAIALVVAFGAKSDSEDAAKQASVAEVQTELSNLVDRLGIAEKTLKRLERGLGGDPTRAALRIGATIHLARAELSSPAPQLRRRLPEMMEWLGRRQLSAAE